MVRGGGGGGFSIPDRLDTCLARTGRPTLVTRRGHPVAALIAVDEDELLDHILANDPEYVRSMSLAEAEAAKGRRGRLLDEVVAELDSEA